MAKILSILLFYYVIALALAVVKLKEQYAWNVLDWNYPDQAMKEQDLASGALIPENALPVGIEHWSNKFFVSVPRWRKGIPATLNYIALDAPHELSPKLTPYPSFKGNELGNCENGLTTVYRIKADKCNRLWVLDVGTYGYDSEVKNICPYTLNVFDLNTDQRLRRYVFRPQDTISTTFIANIALDEGQTCDDIFAYFSDELGYGLIAYSWKQNKSWRFSHSYFMPDPLVGSFNIGGLDFQWGTEGIFGITTSPPGPDGYRTLYFSPLASYMEFSVSTRILRDESKTIGSYKDFKVVGSRGNNTHTTAKVMDEYGVELFNLVDQSAIGCWNSALPLEAHNIAVIDKDDHVLRFPCDIKIDEDRNVWVISDDMPVFLEAVLNYTNINFRIHSAPLDSLLHGTVCHTSLSENIKAPINRFGSGSEDYFQVIGTSQRQTIQTTKINSTILPTHTNRTCGSECLQPKVCYNEECVCPEGFGGFNCNKEICRKNCSIHLNGGKCDSRYGRCLCNRDFGGDDCSIKLDKTQLVFAELFNSDFLSENLNYLRKNLPRFGHSLVAYAGGLWMFGGYSLSDGPLNDMRFYDTQKNIWVPITVDVTDNKIPPGRYFHAADICHSKQSIYIYGGLTQQNESDQNKTLNDFWQFSLKNQKWNEIKSNGKILPPLAGHTLTLQKYKNYESLVLIGGFSHEEGFMSDIWEFHLNYDKWIKLNTIGAKPMGIMGHSTVYHAPSQSLFIFGGTQQLQNNTIISNKLYSFHYPTKIWREIPTYPSLNNVYDNLPRATFLHSAVTTDDYMIAFGGRTDSDDRTDSLIAYVYSTRRWVKLTKGPSSSEHSLPSIVAHAMAINKESENDWNIYVVGGWTGSANCQVTRITLPDDLCYLWSSSKAECSSHIGCSFISHEYYTKCYSISNQGAMFSNFYENQKHSNTYPDDYDE